MPIGILSAASVLFRGIQAAGQGGNLARLALTGVRATRGGQSGRLLRFAQIPGWLRAAMSAAGIAGAVDLFIPDDLIGNVGQALNLPGQGAAGRWANSPYGAPTKEWQTVNNGVTIYFASFTTPSGGTMNGVIRKDGSYRYWRPKKPIVLTSSGASDLRTLIKANTVIEKQLRQVKKIVDKRFPPRRAPRRRTGGSTTIIESGPGDVVR